MKDLAWRLVFEQKTNKGNTNTILSNPQLTEGGEGEEGAVSGELKIFD